MLTVLSLLDDRSRPKGSRDPLGIEAIWSFMGRKLVGNLTTVTDNLDHFIVALLCCDYAKNYKEQDNIQDAFLRAEQLCAYLRIATGNERLLGITRAKANYEQGLLKLGRSEEAQILSNQLSYGLWGLYSTAMQVAGLITGAERQLTDRGTLLVQEIKAFLGEGFWNEFVKMANSEYIKKEQIALCAESFKVMLNDSILRNSVVLALLTWTGAKPLQRELYLQANVYLRQFNTEIDIRKFCTWLLEHQDTGEILKITIKQILSLEPLLILSGKLMDWLQGQKGCEYKKVVLDIQDRLVELDLSECWQSESRIPHRCFLNEIYNAARDKNAGKLVDAILAQNKNVMAQRGGAAWLERQGDYLLVRVVNDRASLPENIAQYCQDQWWNSYFIGSFLKIAKEAV